MGLSALDHELDKLKSQLADLSSHYSDRYPDVRKLKQQIINTESMRDQLLADLKKKANSPQTEDSDSDSDTIAAHDATDPAHGLPITQLQSQLHSNQLQIKNHEEAIAILKSKVTDYQARLNQDPVREQQLSDLTRGYEQSKANYDDLLRQKNDSAMATRMEVLQQGERFRILDPPSLPVKPDFPNRLKFCGIGLMLGVVLGSGVVGAFELMDDRLYDEKLLKNLLPVTVVSEIPPIVNSSDEQKNKRKIWLGWAIAGLVLVAVLMGSAVSFLRG